MEKLIRWWVGAEPDHCQRGRQRLLLISLLAICAATFALGVPRIRLAGHDVFVCLDGAWRILNGQRPVLDFFASKGPAWYLLFAAGLALAGNNVMGLCYSSTIAAVVMSAWTFLVLRKRMEPAPCFLACISIVLLAVSPFPLGEYPTSTSFAMTYNRYGSALASLVLLECFLPSSLQDRFQKQFAGGFSSGFACAVMLCVKVSYGMVGLLLVGVSVVLRPRERARWFGLAAGFTIFVLRILAYLRFDVVSIVREYHIMAVARGGTITVRSIMQRLWRDRFEFMPVLLIILVAFFSTRESRRRVTLAVIGLQAAVCGTLLIMTNMQGSDLPLMTAVGLLIVNEITHALMRPKSDLNGLAPQVGLIFLSFGLLVSGVPLSTDAAGLAFALADKVTHRAASYHFRAPHLEALEFVELNLPDPSYYNGELFVRYTEEGLDLVKAHSGANESVRSMMLANPFSFALLRPPPRGGVVDISWVNFSEKLMPPLDSIVGDVDLIMIPKIPDAQWETGVLVLSKYHDAIESKYLIEAETPHWRLLRKRALHGR